MPSVDRLHPETSYSPTSKVGRYEISNATYPLNQENDHFVRFYINLDDESRLIRENKVQVLGDVDRTDQNRANRGKASQARVDAVAFAGGAAFMGTAAAQLVDSSRVRDPVTKKQTNLLSNLSGWKGGAGRAVSGFADKYPNVTKVIGAGIGGAIGLAAAQTLNVTKTLKRLGATITLYTPPAISVNYDMNWEPTTSDIVDLMSTDRGQEMLENVASFNIKDGLGAKITKILATNASKDIQLVTRTAKNPKKDFLFRDVQQRKFSFGYTFAPQSPKEAEEVAKIIYMFKLFAHPELLDGFDNFLYVYPAEWDIVYGFKNSSRDPDEPWDGDDSNPYLNRISSCVLQNIHVNYTGSGSFQTLRRGEPVVTTLQLVFLELESLHQARIIAGY